MKWRYFLGSVIIATMLLLSLGAPPLPVGLGVLLALAFNLWKTKEV